jgi:hypothetical protein
MRVVGEGLNGFFLYAGEARSGPGRVLMTFGLDLLAGHPEGACLLDGLIRYARSDAFNPKGEITLALERRNGWQKTISAGDSAQDNLVPGATQLDVARAMKGQNELVWETLPAPANVRQQPAYEVSWLGGMGYFAQPPGSFTLYVNDEQALEIPAISERDAAWQNADKTITLKYVRDLDTAEYGTLTLTLPSAKVAPGQPLRLKIIGSDSNSRRWFGVFQTW